MKKLFLLLLLIPALAYGEGRTIMLQYGGPDFSGLTVDLIPSVDNTYDLGSSTKEWKDLYIDGTANLDVVDIDGNVTIQPAADSTTAVQVLDADGGTPVLNVDTDGENVTVGTSDVDGTPAVGKLTVKGSTNDGTTNILVGRDSDEANVFSFDTDGYIKSTGISLSNNDSGTSNTIFGKNAGLSLDAGSNHNVFIGENVSDAAMNDAINNVGVGYQALSGLTTGDENVGIGNIALTAVIDGGRNVAIGHAAAYQLTSGGNNVAIGPIALANTTTGSANTAVGTGTLQNQNGNGSIAIGYNAGNLANASGELYIDNQIRASNAVEKTNSIIYGVMAAAPADQDLNFNADVIVSGSHAAESYTADATSAPAVSFTDDDGADNDVSGKIYNNLTTVTTGAEVGDMYFQVMGGAGTAGTMETFMDYDASNRALTVQGSINSAPMTETVTTEANMTDPITSSVVLIVGDDDTDNDAIDLQDGTTAGQILHLIASAGVDADDTMTINMADTTCTNCPAIAFDKVGENASLIWTGATWVVTGLQSSL